VLTDGTIPPKRLSYTSTTTSSLYSCLCLLDLSAAFDTIDHDILLTRLSSWFGIHGSVLKWFKSYLSSRTFCVKCNDLHTSLYGVPQGSVLGHVLFIMYTTPLSTLISSLSLYHPLYAYDTHLLISFHPSGFQANISHLQNALTQITSRMTSNLLSLNSSKTEFLLIGLKQLLSMIHSSSTSIDTIRRDDSATCSSRVSTCIEEIDHWMAANDGSCQSAYNLLVHLCTSHQELPTRTHPDHCSDGSQKPDCHKARLLQQPSDRLHQTDS